MEPVFTAPETEALGTWPYERLKTKPFEVLLLSQQINITTNIRQNNQIIKRYDRFVFLNLFAIDLNKLIICLHAILNQFEITSSSSRYRNKIRFSNLHKITWF